MAEPVAAAVIGILVFGERLNAIVLTGTALLLSAVLFLAADEGGWSSGFPKDAGC
ncbi:hypothetical protein O3S80_18970 [Streptomyces sp. Lzd4kr]|nr:hypothetical protein [Streptomyces sp. Lzd4kr]